MTEHLELRLKNSPENMWIKPKKIQKKKKKTTCWSFHSGTLETKKNTKKQYKSHKRQREGERCVHCARDGSHVSSPCWRSGIKNTLGTSVVTFLAQKQNPPKNLTT